MYSYVHMCTRIWNRVLVYTHQPPENYFMHEIYLYTFERQKSDKLEKNTTFDQETFRQFL